MVVQSRGATEREHLGHMAFGIEDLNLAGQVAAHLRGVDDRLDETAMIDVFGKNSLTGELEALLNRADWSNLEVERHMFS